MSKKSRAKRSKRTGRPGRNGEADFWAPGYGRAALGRMDEIRALISAGKYPNSHTIARELSWSVRTVKRDLAFIRERLKWPLEFSQERNGFYFTNPVPYFPAIPLTEKETVGLFVAQKAIDQFKGTALEPVLGSAFRKMMAALDDSVKYSLGDLDGVVSIRPLAPGDADIEKFQIFTRAIREKRVLRFVYRGHGKVVTKYRAVHPCRVGYVNNLWTLFAFDPKADSMRKFVFFRVTELKLTDERFTVMHAFDLNKELEGSMGLFKGNEMHDVAIEFDAWGADDVRGRTWHASQKLTDRADGTLLVTMRLNNLEEIEKWVLGFGEHATVMKPQKLRERVGKIGAQLAGRYGGSGSAL